MRVGKLRILPWCVVVDVGDSDHHWNWIGRLAGAQPLAHDVHGHRGRPRLVLLVQRAREDEVLGIDLYVHGDLNAVVFEAQSDVTSNLSIHSQSANYLSHLERFFDEESFGGAATLQKAALVVLCSDEGQ